MKIQRIFKEPVTHKVKRILYENTFETVCGKWLDIHNYKVIDDVEKVTCSQCISAFTVNDINEENQITKPDYELL